MWQDWVIACCQGSMVLALLPGIVQGMRAPLLTCSYTVVSLLLMSWALWTLQLRWSSYCALACGGEWAIITAYNVGVRWREWEP